MSRKDVQDKINALNLLKLRWIKKRMEADVVDASEADKRDYRAKCDAMVKHYAGHASNRIITHVRVSSRGPYFVKFGITHMTATKKRRQQIANRNKITSVNKTYIILDVVFKIESKYSSASFKVLLENPQDDHTVRSICNHEWIQKVEVSYGVASFIKKVDGFLGVGTTTVKTPTLVFASKVSELSSILDEHMLSLI